MDSEKEFEDWWKEHKQYYAGYSGCKESWQASRRKALEWVYKQLDYSSENELIKDIIQEKLENLNGKDSQEKTL